MRVYTLKSLLISLVLVAGLIGLGKSNSAYAAPGLRLQVDQHGDFVLIGNTFGYDCAAGTPAPVVGAIGSCGTNTADSSPDIFWRSDSPSAGQAEANDAITAAQARSTAVLAIPAGAQVTHAYLYWSALNSGVADDTATFERPGAFSSSITALQSIVSASTRYLSVADVTALVQTHR